MRRILCLLTTALIFSFAHCGTAQQFEKNETTWRINGNTYSAVIDQSGNLRQLTVNGTPFLGETKKDDRTLIGGAFPGTRPAESIERDGDTIHIKRDQVSVKYTFDKKGFTINTKGGQVQWALSDQVRACISETAVVPPSEAKGDIHTIVAGNTALKIDEPYHILWGRLSPSFLTRGGKKSDAFEARFTCGVDVDPFELITMKRLTPTGRNWKKTARYVPGETPSMTLKLASLAGSDVDLDVKFRVINHPKKGETVLTRTKSVTVPAGKKKNVSANLPVDEPGLYWTYANLIQNDKSTLQRRRGFIYNRDQFKPPLTRPDDFEKFWKHTLSEMREIPFDAKRSKNEKRSNKQYVHYDLTINDFDGDRYRTFLRIPRGDDSFNAEVLTTGNKPGNPPMKQFKKLENQDPGVGMWQRGEKRIRIGARLPNESRFNRWNGRDDNNMLHSYLRALRMMDYLRTLDRVDHLFLFGASRSGPIMLVVAALSPEQVAAVNVHVPTSCGLSWENRPYQGWGSLPSRSKEGRKTAAYFDPVNHAPDLEVPLIMDGGFYDGLAPAPGIVAFHNHATNAPFRRCHIEQGQHGYFKVSHRKQMRKALAEHLRKTQGIDPTKSN